MPKYAPADRGVPALASYLSGTAVACGTASTSVTVPTGATSALISAAGAAVYYNVNGESAGTTSPGYVPQDTNGFVFAVDNLSALYVAGGAAAAVAHIQFYQD